MAGEEITNASYAQTGSSLPLKNESTEVSARPTVPPEPLPLVDNNGQKKFKFNANLGLGASIMTHPVSGDSMPVAGLNAGAGLTYRPNSTTSFSGGVSATAGYGSEIGANLSFDKKLNDKFSVGANLYAQTMLSGKTYNESASAKSEVHKNIDGKDYNLTSEATVSRDYRQGTNVAGAEATLTWQPNDKLSFNGAAGVKYAGNRGLNSFKHSVTAANNYDVVGSDGVIIGNLSSIATASINKELSGDKVSPNLKAGMKYEPTKKTYIKANVEVDPTNFKNNAGMVTFGVNLGKTKKN